MRNSLVLLFSLMSMAAEADGLMTGATLQRLCAQPGGEHVCSSYALGFFDGMLAQKFGKQICLPRVPADEVRLVFEKYLRDHPERLHEEAWLLVSAALAAGFPCAR